MNRIRAASAGNRRGRMDTALRRFVDRPEGRESGQALIIVLIAIMLLVLIAPIVVSETASEDNSVSIAGNFAAALTAAEAGIQQYQNYLDSESDYWKYSGTNCPGALCNDDGDNALDTGANGWKTIPGSSPPEAFHYDPNTTFLSKGAGAGTASILLTVTGRSGTTGHYVYRSLQTTLSSKGLLSNAYFSQYETLDWQQDTTPVTVTTYSTLTGCTTTKNSATVGGNTTTCNLSAVLPTYTVTDTPNNLPNGTVVNTVVTTGSTSMTLSNNASSNATVSVTIGVTAQDSVGPGVGGAPTMVANQSFWQSLCQYDTYQPNTFIDSLGSLTPSQAIANPYVAGQNYSAAYPYYGPFRGNRPDSGSNVNTFTFTYVGGQTASVLDPCGQIFNFLTGETLTGPVYTNDQLWVCGNPTFANGVTSGIPVGFKYAYANWPANEPAGVGSNGWIDDSQLNWDASCGGGGTSSPTIKNPGPAATLSGSSVLPPLDTSLLNTAQKSGCVYYGPTMIEFLANGTFNVWSPNSTGANAPPAACGTFTVAAPFAAGLTIPVATGLLIYVENTTGAPLAASSVSGLPTGATCSNPWKPYAPPAICSTVGDEGDAIVEGELQGEVTLGAQSNIVISRDLTYACADSGGNTPASQESGSFTLPALCSIEANPDVLGLAANADVIVEHPAPSAIPPNDAYPFTPPSSGNFTLSCNGSATISLASNASSPTIFNALNNVAACGANPPLAVATAGSGFTITLAASIPLTSSAGNISPPSNSDDNTGAPPNQTEPWEWPSTSNTQYCTVDGTETQAGAPAGTVAALTTDAFPDCIVQNPVIDAAIVSVQGSFADEDWDLGGGNDGGVWLQGTDVSDLRGPFGTAGSPCLSSLNSGYCKEFTYDTRLLYLTPPSMIDIANLTWAGNSFVNCGDANDQSDPVNPCPGLDWLNS